MIGRQVVCPVKQKLSKLHKR